MKSTVSAKFPLLITVAHQSPARTTIENPMIEIHGKQFLICGDNVHTIGECVMGSTRVNFRLPEDLIEKADVAAEVSKKNRTEIVKEALQEYLADIEDDEAFKEAVVELYLDDQIGFDVLKEFIGRQDAESIRASKTILDQGEDLADDLAEL